MHSHPPPTVPLHTRTLFAPNLAQYVTELVTVGTGIGAADEGGPGMNTLAVTAGNGRGTPETARDRRSTPR